MRIIIHIVLTTLVSILFFTNSVAQAGGGVRAGVNGSYLTNSDYVPKPGFHVGAYFKVPVSEFVYLQPEATFSQKGAQTELANSKKYYNPFTGQYYKKEKLTLDYLDLTLLSRFNLKGGFHLLIGPQFSILLQDLYKYTNGNNDRDTYDYANDRRIDVGFQGGVGLELESGFLFGLRGETGLISISDSKKYKNLVLAATVGYTIFGKRY